MTSAEAKELAKQRELEIIKSLISEKADQGLNFLVYHIIYQENKAEITHPDLKFKYNGSVITW